MTQKVTNSHDKFFKETLTDLHTARDFLKNYLPAEVTDILDLQKLELQKDTFVDKKLRGMQSDLLFKTKILNKGVPEEAFVYMLFEHKSYPDRKTGLQLLKYMTAIWESLLANAKSTNNPDSQTLPVIIPIVVYHGERPWPWENSLAPLFRGGEEPIEAMQKYIPAFQYELHDFSPRSRPNIRGEMKLKIFLNGLQVAFTNDREEILSIYRRILQILSSREPGREIAEYMETLLLYILQTQEIVDIEDLSKTSEDQKMMGGDFIMTIADRLREEGIKIGVKKGQEEGIKKGHEEAQREIISNMLKMGISDKEIARLTKASMETILKIKEETL